MTFEEFANLISSCGDGKTLIYVFEDEDTADQFASFGVLDGLTFVHSSDYTASTTLLDRWCKAKVYLVTAKGKNELVVVIDKEAVENAE